MIPKSHISDAYLFSDIRRRCPHRLNPREENKVLFPNVRKSAAAAEEFIVSNMPLCVKNADCYIKRHPSAAPYRDDLISDGFAWLTQFVRRVQDGELTIKDDVTTYMIVGLRHCVAKRGWHYEHPIAVPRVGVAPEVRDRFPKVRQGETAMCEALEVPAPDLYGPIDTLDLLAKCCRSLKEYQMVLARFSRNTWSEIASLLQITTPKGRHDLLKLRDRYKQRVAELDAEHSQSVSRSRGTT